MRANAALIAPGGEAPYMMRQSGRAALLPPQGMHARPFEFKYTAEFIPKRGDQPVAVVGHRTLIVDGANATKLQICGYPGLDQKLLALRETLRRRPCVPQAETADALLVLAALCNLAGRAIQDAEFKGRWDEAAFQRFVRAELRRHPLVGADLDEHAHAAGGITDLSLCGMPIELKAVDTLISSVDQCESFLAQTASYTVAKSKRTAILCVLDTSDKEDGAGAARGAARHPHPGPRRPVDLRAGDSGQFGSPERIVALRTRRLCSHTRSVHLVRVLQNWCPPNHLD